MDSYRCTYSASLTKADALGVDAIVSTEAADRVGDVVVASGVDLTAYKRNPVVLWSHDYSIPPIGKATEIRSTGHALRARFEFADTPRGREVAQLFAGGFLSAFSIGFRPTTKPEPRPGGKGLRFPATELLEISAVGVPAHQDALVVGRAMPVGSKSMRGAGADVASLRADLADYRRRWEHDCKGLDAIQDDLRRQENWLRAIKLEIQQAIRYS